jgi:hypothetical protein
MANTKYEGKKTAPPPIEFIDPWGMLSGAHTLHALTAGENLPR